jgi:Tfp pilus assembly protein PilE
MRSLLTITKGRTSSKGFTLVELLIIAPIVVVLVSGFVALMISMVGDVLTTREQTNATYESQDALDRIERDTRLSNTFLTTTGTLTSPQGSDNSFNGTAAFTNTSSTLILNELATDANPASTTRWLIYYANQPNACGSQQETSNVPFTIRVVYFLKNGSLWRRTIVPDFNHNAIVDAQTICATTHDPWQQNSCSPGYTDARCKTEDEQIVRNVTSFTMKYYSSPSGTTDLGPTGAAGATTVETTINTGNSIAGRAYTSSVSLRATHLNTTSSN